MPTEACPQLSSAAICSSGRRSASWRTRCSSCSARSTSMPSRGDRAGRYVAAGVIAIAAIYQLTPLKDVCLAKCRSPLAFVVGSWRSGRIGAARMGIEHGAWCVGCCWALMATLFALGLMSITWTVVIAAVVALEKLLPWERRQPRRGAAADRCRARGRVRPGPRARADLQRSDPMDDAGMRWTELGAVRRVLEGRLVAAAAAQLELERTVVDAEQVGDHLPARSGRGPGSRRSRSPGRRPARGRAR